MEENQFKVYCEIEVDGKSHKSMESPASWFLMTQTGKLWSHSPGEIARPLEKEYKVAIPLFYTGLKDGNGDKIYKGDIIAICGYVNHIVGFEKGMFVWENIRPVMPIYKMLEAHHCVIVGNIERDKRMMKEKKKKKRKRKQAIVEELGIRGVMSRRVSVQKGGCVRKEE